ncbi:MAG: hypothetical protein WBX11_07225 [Thiobacillaceae bacterium]
MRALLLPSLVVAFLAAAAAFWWRRSATLSKRQAALAVKRNAPRGYHSVEVRCGSAACDAVKRLGETRFLSDEAPLLPVPGCTAQQCTCRYIHFADRRRDDRRNPYGQWTSTPPVITGERRLRIERRKSPEDVFGRTTGSRSKS